MVKSIVQESCATLVPSLTDSVEKFQSALNKSVSEAFHAGFIEAQLDVNIEVYGIILLSKGDAGSEEGGAFFKGKYVIEPEGDKEVIEL